MSLLPSLIVVDNFLKDPNLIRNQVLDLDFSVTGTFPGVRTLAADQEYQSFIQKKFEKILNHKIKNWKMDSFSFQLCYEDAESWVHSDDAAWAGVLYLTPDAPLDSGTGIFRETDGEFELIDAVANVYNRLIIYRGTDLHSSLKSGFGNTPITGRLTQVFFFDLHQHLDKETIDE